MDDDCRLFTVKNFADYLGVSNSTILRMIKRGEIDFGFKLGMYWRFKRDDIESWIEDCKQPRGRSGPQDKPLPKQLDAPIAVQLPKVDEQSAFGGS